MYTKLKAQEIKELKAIIAYHNAQLAALTHTNVHAWWQDLGAKPGKVPHGASVLYSCYKRWCELTNQEAVSQSKFGRVLKKELKITRSRSQGGSVYLLNIPK